MTFNQFRESLKTKFMYEAIYEDSEGREILVIGTLDAYSMMRRIKPWVGLTDEEVKQIADSEWEEAFVRLIEAKLKEKNT